MKINSIKLSLDIPVKSHADFGLMMPELGRTQNLFGDVVLTYQMNNDPYVTKILVKTPSIDR